MATLAGQTTAQLLQAATIEHSRWRGARHAGLTQAAETARRRLAGVIGELVRRGTVTPDAARELLEGEHLA